MAFRFFSRTRLRDIGRRLLMQTMMSGAAMIALNLASSLDLHLVFGPAQAPAVAVTEPVRTAAAAVAASPPASEKSARLAVWREREAPPAPTAAPVRAPSPAHRVAAAEGVILFDQCRPDCPSRDPLLIRASAPSPLVLAANSQPASPEALPASEAEEPVPPAAPREGLLSGALAGTLGGARDLAGGVARLAGW